MIRVRIIHSRGWVSGLEVEGHSGLGSPGQDVLCAAASVLVENLGNTFLHILQVEAGIEKAEGYYSIKLNDSDLSRDTEVLFASVILGMKSLQKDYPDRIKMQFPGG